MDGLLEMVKDRPVVIPDVADRFNFRCAASKLLALALLSFEPRNLLTGDRLAAGQLMRRVPSVHDSSPLPQIFSVRPGESDEHEGYLQSAANRIFHPPHQGGICPMSEGDLQAVWLTLKLAASTTAILLLLSPPLAWLASVVMDAF